MSICLEILSLLVAPSLHESVAWYSGQTCAVTASPSSRELCFDWQLRVINVEGTRGTILVVGYLHWSVPSSSTQFLLYICCFLPPFPTFAVNFQCQSSTFAYENPLICHLNASFHDTTVIRSYHRLESSFCPIHFLLFLLFKTYVTVVYIDL